MFVSRSDGVQQLVGASASIGVAAPVSVAGGVGVRAVAVVGLHPSIRAERSGVGAVAEERHRALRGQHRAQREDARGRGVVSTAPLGEGANSAATNTRRCRGERAAPDVVWPECGDLQSGARRCDRWCEHDDPLPSSCIALHKGAQHDRIAAGKCRIIQWGNLREWRDLRSLAASRGRRHLHRCADRVGRDNGRLRAGRRIDQS